jgi:ABC-type iron transport system FetAB ATPase subunit
MAVVIASALDKDVAGAPLFRGVSFKLERGDRMTLAGRNGAGKTTLLRMLAGQTSVDGGELSFEKGASRALSAVRRTRLRAASRRARPPRAVPARGAGGFPRGIRDQSRPHADGDQAFAPCVRRV